MFSGNMKYIWISYHLSLLRWCSWLKSFLMEYKDLFMVHYQYCRMDTDDLMTKEEKASVTAILIYFSRYISASAPEVSGWGVLRCCPPSAMWAGPLIFLAATKQLCKWYFPSVCPSVRLSVTPFSPCSHHRIIMKFSGVITMVKSDVHAKGQGQRSNVKVTEVNTQLSRFRTLTLKL